MRPLPLHHVNTFCFVSNALYYNFQDSCSANRNRRGTKIEVKDIDDKITVDHRLRVLVQDDPNRLIGENSSFRGFSSNFRANTQIFQKIFRFLYKPKHSVVNFGSVGIDFGSVGSFYVFKSMSEENWAQDFIVG
jgi:hypothetical protein